MDDDIVELTLRIPAETLQALSTHAERDGVTSAMIAQRWLADRKLQECMQRARIVRLSSLPQHLPLSYGMGGYDSLAKPKEP